MLKRISIIIEALKRIKSKIFKNYGDLFIYSDQL